MNDNEAVNVLIERMDGATGVLTQIVKTARVTEVALSAAAVNNFTATPTSTLVKRGDRLRVRVFFDDAGTMAAPGPAYFTYGNATAAANGDSWIQFTENLTFEPAGDPGQSVIEQATRNVSIITNSGVGGFAMLAQPFVAKGSLTEIKLWLIRSTTAPTDNLIIEIQSNSGGNPSGTVVGQVDTIFPSDVTTTWTQYTWPVNIALTPGATYHLVCRNSSGTTPANAYEVGASNVGAGPEGVVARLALHG